LMMANWRRGDPDLLHEWGLTGRVPGLIVPSYVALVAMILNLPCGARQPEPIGARMPPWWTRQRARGGAAGRGP
jgi:hypothetical protein